jgi:glutaredoxin
MLDEEFKLKCVTIDSNDNEEYIEIKENQQEYLPCITFNENEILFCEESEEIENSENDKENDLYHILSMLGIKVRKFSIYDKSGFLPNIVYPKNAEFNLKKYVMSFDELSRIKISLCPYKFGVENIAQNDRSIYLK